MNDKLIVIVGFMGCGKTVVGRELSHLLNKRFDDLDELIEKCEQRSPAKIISEDGEQSFREIETAALRNLLDHDESAVVTLGGGAWTREVNRQFIRASNGVVVWLDVPFNVCWERIERDPAPRPLAPSRPAAERLFLERLQFYRLADVHLRVSVESPIDIAKNIAALLQQQFGS